MISSSRPMQTAWHGERVLGSPRVSSLTTLPLDWRRDLRRDIHAHMLLSLVRASVLELLEEHGPLTTNELLAFDPELAVSKRRRHSEWPTACVVTSEGSAGGSSDTGDWASAGAAKSHTTMTPKRAPLVGEPRHGADRNATTESR